MTWIYTWSSGLGSTSDGYELEESISGPTSGFTRIDTISRGSQTETIYHDLVKPTGNYWYRVRAVASSGPSPYSNVKYVAVQSSCTETPTRTKIKIINDLYDEVEGVFPNQIDWKKLNTVIRVRVAATDTEAYNANTEDLLYNSEIAYSILDCVDIPPNDHNDSSYMEFDVSHIQPGSDNIYYLFIQCVWWDHIFDVNTFAYLYSEKRNSMDFNCYGQCCVEKWILIPIFQPYCDPEIIRLSEFLPLKNWPGHFTCP